MTREHCDKAEHRMERTCLKHRHGDSANARPRRRRL
jgi:hypothetical protein